MKITDAFVEVKIGVIFNNKATTVFCDVARFKATKPVTSKVLFLWSMYWCKNHILSWLWVQVWVGSSSSR